MTDRDQKQLGRTLWAIADQLRGAMNADDHFPDATKMVPFAVNHSAFQISATAEESSIVAHDCGHGIPQTQH